MLRTWNLIHRRERIGRVFASEFISLFFFFSREIFATDEDPGRSLACLIRATTRAIRFSVRRALPQIYACALCTNASCARIHTHTHIYTMPRNDRRSQSSDRHTKCARARSLIKRLIMPRLPISLRPQLRVLHNVDRSFTSRSARRGAREYESGRDIHFIPPLCRLMADTV